MVSTKDFENYLERKSLILKHWGLPGIELKFSKIDSGKYLMRIFKSGTELFESSDRFNFQIHYGEKERLVGLFVKSGDRGWFLESTDIFEETNIGIGILYMFRNRKELMQEIYERECHETVG